MRTVELEIAEYEPSTGFVTPFEDDSVIVVELEKNGVEIRANRAGLRSLAAHFLALAQSDIPEGTHTHMIPYGQLEPGSIELLVGVMSGEQVAALPQDHPPIDEAWAPGSS